MQEISQYFIKGDMKGAIAYMRCHQGFSKILPAYLAIFEEEEYIDYPIPACLNDVLRIYQKYFRDVFYLGVEHDRAKERLMSRLCDLLDMENVCEVKINDRLTALFESHGYHAQFGLTMGYYGPYIWKETVPTTYEVELPEGKALYQVNILRGFILRSYMGYLTFDMFGTKGWASNDGTINCIEGTYDFNSDAFLVSLLKHEAQHVEDKKRYPDISVTDLEYRAKLVELCYSNDPGLLPKFLAEADDSRADNSHAMASCKIRDGFQDFLELSVEAIKERALKLFFEDTQRRKG